MNKKQLILKLSAIAVSVLLASCGGDGYYGKENGNNGTVVAQIATVTITIRDVTGFAIPAAIVKIGESEMIANEQGIVTFRLESGKTHSATVTANGYQVTNADVTVGAGQTTATQTIRITPLSAENSTVIARVFNGETGTVLANTQIQVGTETKTTGANGDVTLSNITNSEKVLFNINSQGFAQQSIVVNTITGQPSNINIQLLPLQLAGSFNPSTNASVSLSNSIAKVDVFANSLARTDSQSINGSVSIKIAPINSILDIHQLPGELTTVDSSGQRQLIESFGAMIINAVDSADNEVTLKTGNVATVSIPVVTRSTTLPATTPLYIYDVEEGYWVKDGSNILTLSTDGKYYTGSTSQFGAVSAATVYQTVEVTGCLADGNGYRLQNVPISLEGVDYSGYSTAITNSNGEFTISARANSTAVVAGQLGRSISNSNKITTAANSYAMSPCLEMTNLSNNVTVKLTWGSLPNDIDSHLLAPNGSLVYYGSKGSLSSAPYAYLDVDDTSSFGPEIVTIRRLMVGDYYYVVHNYSGTYNPGITDSPTRVELNTPTGSELFVPNSGESVNMVNKNYWHVFTLRVDTNCNISVIPVRQWLDSEISLKRPQQTPSYCVPNEVLN
ncbi:YfaP family protein [Acinetobacter venetianus]|uniref:YfaP family protein n=1 Tax=Acinetobacter venetianus TaxID=52133 RepID=UPI0007781A4D|nr:hypothetical protein [Acinetobacter venetianus]KXZ66958.1 hypothetical protein AVENLUH7437_00452 [Acinetobacter venetianus]